MPNDNSDLPTASRFRVIQLPRPEPDEPEWGSPKDVLEDAAANHDKFAEGVLVLGWDEDGNLSIANCNRLTIGDQIVLLLAALDEVRNPTG